MFCRFKARWSRGTVIGSCNWFIRSFQDGTPAPAAPPTPAATVPSTPASRTSPATTPPFQALSANTPAKARPPSAAPAPSSAAASSAAPSSAADSSAPPPVAVINLVEQDWSFDDKTIYTIFVVKNLGLCGAPAQHYQPIRTSIKTTLVTSSSIGRRMCLNFVLKSILTLSACAPIH